MSLYDNVKHVTLAAERKKGKQTPGENEFKVMSAFIIKKKSAKNSASAMYES
jgi:hypothetical protein